MIFSSEMHRLATASRQKSDSWLRHAEALQNVDPEYAHLLRSRAQLAESQSAKYINRQHRLNNNLRTHHDLPVIDAEQTGLNRSLERIQALGRGPATRVDAARVRSLNRLALQQSSDNLVDTFAQVARLSPGQSGAASRAIANELINMPAANAGEAISRLERSAGSRFARDVAENARQLRAARSTPSARLTPEPPAGIGVVKILTTSIGAYFMGREGVYHALSQTEGDDTAFDFVVRVYTNAAWYGSGIGYAYEEAEQAEIERFTRRLERGEDPSLLHAVNVILLKIPYLMARDSAFGLLYLPDSIYEAITGEQEAKAREQASIDFLAEVQRLVQHRESIDEALLYAEDMGIYPEDRQRFLNCLCTRCGGALGGMFCSEPCPRNFPGRRGPCLCRGTLNTWNTPIPGGTQDSLDCFNAITRKNHAEALAIFNSWRDQMIAENFQSAEHDLKLINESIEAGELDTALSTFRMIQPLINDYVVPVDTGLAIVQSLPGRELGNRIGQALVDEALTIISDPDHANPMATALDRVARAQQISPLVWQQTRNRFENWDENWREVLQTTLPAVIADAEAGSLVSARASLDEVLDRLGSDLPPRRDDPRILAALEKLSDQELMLATAEKYWENARQYQAAADFEQAIAAYR